MEFSDCGVTVRVPFDNPQDNMSNLSDVGASGLTNRSFLRVVHATCSPSGFLRFEEAFIYAQSIDFGTYERQRDKVQENLAVADLELHEARIDRIDVEGVLGFAEHLIANAARAWMEASLEQRQQIQSAIFPRAPLRRSGIWNRSNVLGFQAVGEIRGPTK